jgi:hypothetical protein
MSNLAESINVTVKAHEVIQDTIWITNDGTVDYTERCPVD